MERCYVVVDVEASGPTPGKYSLLSLGACTVERQKSFYRELKPISRNYVLDAMKVACRGLRCLDECKEPEYNPSSEAFRPDLVLNVLYGAGQEPAKAMLDFAGWVRDVSSGYRPELVAAPVLFDGMFVFWYFDHFAEGRNPFGHGGNDINDLYKGCVGNMRACTKHLKLRRNGEMTHNALEDAVQEARELEEVLRLMREKREG